MKAKRLHLNTVGIASCGQAHGELADFTAAITCRFCQGILRLRLTRNLRAVTTQEWTKCRLRGNDVWAQSANGVLTTDDDGCVVVTSDLDKGKRYRAHRNVLMLASS